jgi:predicted kinase
MREMLTDDPGDQGASAEAFQVLSIIVNGRLRRRLLTVVDATNLRAANRRRYQRLAARYGIPTVAIAFQLPVGTYHERNRARDDRVVPDFVIADQAERMAKVPIALADEGYAAVHVVGDGPLSVHVERDSRGVRDSPASEPDAAG